MSIGLDCCEGRRSSGTTTALHGGAPAKALDVHFEKSGVVDEAIDGGEGDGGVGEEFPPFADGLIGGDSRERRS